MCSLKCSKFTQGRRQQQTRYVECSGFQDLVLDGRFCIIFQCWGWSFSFFGDVGKTLMWLFFQSRIFCFCITSVVCTVIRDTLF